ncbi:MAG: TetR/AcrR family transcriptional regulator [Nitrospirae bacterium]|nr:TetR/AcrR family transcriptional regulator [Nitrospirota bacterium]
MLKKNRREEILTAAITIFSQKGYHDTTIADLIEKAGIARGTFYLYFENKRQIFDSILDNLLLEIDRCIRTIKIGETGPEKTDPLDQLRANLTRLFTLFIENPELSRILLRHATGLDEESDQKLTEFYSNLALKIEEALRLGTKMNLIRECDPRITSYCILGSIREVIEHITLTRRDTSEIDTIIEEVLGFGLYGLMNPGLLE